jgi:hypothetical protein
MEQQTILYADSRQRDVSLYPSGNSYTLFLQTPVHNIKKVDLVSAKIPNTIYNLTSSSNVITIDSSSNIFLNSGFYSSISLVNAINGQDPNVSVAYLDAQGKFIFYGTFDTLTCLNAEIAEILGLPIGDTDALSLSDNPSYSVMFPGFRHYVISENIVSLEVNDYVWLDIEEFRTPFTTDARKLVLNPQGVYTTNSNTSARSFAVIPIDVPSGAIKSFKESSDFKVSVEFPSRIDSLQRLTIKWLDRYGNPLDFRGLEVNSFTIRIYTVHVPDQVERPVSLPPPVPYELERKNVVRGAVLALIIGLFLILLIGKKRPG